MTKKKMIALLLVFGCLAFSGCSRVSDEEPSDYLPEEEVSEPEVSDTDAETAGTSEEESQDNSEVSVVYMTTDISGDGLLVVYEALG